MGTQRTRHPFPILAPLADFAGVQRSLVVTAFQSASGEANLIVPTSVVVMGGLALGRVPYERWLRFMWRPLVILSHHHARHQRTVTLRLSTGVATMEGSAGRAVSEFVHKSDRSQ